MFRILYDKPQPLTQIQQPSSPLWKEMNINDIKALEDLMELWDEGHIDETEYIEADLLQSGQVAAFPKLVPSPIMSLPKDYNLKSHTFPTLQGNPSVWAFTQQVTNEIRKSKWKGLTQSNLTPAQKEALISLQQEMHLIIKPSDKEGNLIVMENSQYESMVMRLLQNRKWYRKIPESHVNYTVTRYRQLLSSASYQGLINNKMWEFLNVPAPKTPTLYALPKIHKNAINPPGRPIVSGIGRDRDRQHQADVCHAYKIIKKNGIPDEQIVAIMHNNIADNEENPIKGIILNCPNRTNVYVGGLKDYTKGEKEFVTPDNFLAVLRGDAEVWWPSCRGTEQDHSVHV
ncbi:hypothetical protein AB205_0155560 [Aquarana catesbeiana]|uniref:Uncharacterized protein n=1 Tax=Aquarana catesbeiana TaxID=8400 RepID=A0A2G9S0Z2_AQUCT|nr:hypothetical protein AB205_0155560 [Aquarana catesbeiana]